MREVYPTLIPKRHRVTAGLAGLALIVTGCASGSRSAHAQAPHSTPRPSANTEKSPVTAKPGSSKFGIDVSYPQCGSKLPTNVAFGIVGLNGYNGATPNPCFEQQVKWAKKLPGKGSFQGLGGEYVHIQNPGADLAKVWPSSGRSPYGTCDGTTTPACSWLYGRQRAQDDIKSLRAARVDGGLVFLDVEKQDYSWQDARDNVAAIAGMAATFRAANYHVGLYSNQMNWAQVAGSVQVPPSVSRLPEWIAGNPDPAAARNSCLHPFLNGVIKVAQIAGSEYPIDLDVACRTAA